MGTWRDGNSSSSCAHKYKGEHSYKCVSDSLYSFVGPIPWGWFLFFIILWIINTVFWIIARIKNRKFISPIWYLIISLLQNFAFTLMIWSIIHVAFGSDVGYIAGFIVGLVFCGLSTGISDIFTNTGIYDGKIKGAFRVRLMMFDNLCACSPYSAHQITCGFNEDGAQAIANRVSGNPPMVLLYQEKMFYSRVRPEPVVYGSWDSPDIKLDLSNKINIFKVSPELEMPEEYQGIINIALSEYKKKILALANSFMQISRQK